MSDLFESPAAPAPSNSPEYTVSELSGAVKRVIEGEFGLVRVRAEVGRVSRPASGHLYYDLKDDRAVIAAITWKGQVARLQALPEEGMEVIATGRMTTFPGQSKYQLIVEDVAPAGAGALMAQLEKRKAALAGEGLFDAARKRPLPYLPGVIGVITSPSGAVIRDILHRLRDRFPRHVLIWPVAVQGQACAGEVAAAIRGFNALPQDGAIPRPDVLIVARGGGSIEDLWGFNEEIVVRAAAASRIPLISAVGHETDTTLIDLAADLRAPTPTAAAELAVPVRLELIAGVEDLQLRLLRGVGQGIWRRGQRLIDLGRGLPRPERLLDAPRQRLDTAGGRLVSALVLVTTRRRGALDRLALRPDLLRRVAERRRAGLEQLGQALVARLARRLDLHRAGLDKWGSRLEPGFQRLLADGQRRIAEGRGQLSRLQARLDAATDQQLTRLGTRLAALDRTRQTLGYTETLQRGYAVIRGAEGQVLTRKALAETARLMEAEFADGRLALVAAGRAETAADAGARGGEKPAERPGAKGGPRSPGASAGGRDNGGQGQLF